MAVVSAALGWECVLVAETFNSLESLEVAFAGQRIRQERARTQVSRALCFDSLSAQNFG